ncbi:MAG: PAS domain-containing protein, partial [Deltaproteobacteria bacterium]|nr:PAS domain-containing protein [Deltaproteobacteria bacterium]
MTGADQAFQERIVLLQEFFDFSPVGFMSLDSKGRILDANLALSTLLEKDPYRLMHRSLYDFVLREDRDILYLHLRKLFKPAPPPPCEIRIRRAPDDMRHLLMKSTLVSDPKRSVIGLSVLMDVTDRVQAQGTFQRIADTSVDIIALMNSRGRIMYCSRSVEVELGYQPQAVVDNPLETFIDPAERNLLQSLLKQVLAGGKAENLELHLLNMEGAYVPFEINAQAYMPHRNAEGAVICCVARNIAARKKFRDQLLKNHREKSEALALLDAIFDAAPVGLGFWDRDLRFVRLNQALADINGLAAEAHLGRKVSEILPDLESVANVESQWRRIIKNGEPVENVEICTETPAAPGEKRYWLDNWFPVRIGKETIGLAATVMDITDRKRMEEALHHAGKELEKKVEKRTRDLTGANEALKKEISKREQYEKELTLSTEKILKESARRKVLAARLVSSVEADRRDMGMYLHDEIGQTLTTVKMRLERIRQGAERTHPPVAHELEETEEALSNILRQVKTMARQMRPDILETLGLAPALGALVETFEKWASFKIYLHRGDLKEDPSPDAALALYRIAQEALTNIAKHADAKEVFIDLIQKEKTILLTLEDDGAGFEGEAIDVRTG